jgi:hypothetical protein
MRASVLSLVYKTCLFTLFVGTAEALIGAASSDSRGTDFWSSGTDFWFSWNRFLVLAEQISGAIHKLSTD